MDNLSFNKRLEESFRLNWGRPALSNYQGITLTYSDIARRISKLHIAFEQFGLQTGDKVAFCSFFVRGIRNIFSSFDGYNYCNIVFYIRVN